MLADKTAKIIAELFGTTNPPLWVVRNRRDALLRQMARWVVIVSDVENETCLDADARRSEQKEWADKVATWDAPAQKEFDRSMLLVANYSHRKRWPEDSSYLPVFRALPAIFDWLYHVEREHLRKDATPATVKKSVPEDPLIADHDLRRRFADGERFTPSTLQRELRVNYHRAQRIIDALSA